MSIQLEIPMTALQRPGVAQALAELVQALGGNVAAVAVAPVAVPPAPAPVALAPQVLQPAPQRARPAAPAPEPMTWKRFEATLTPATREFLKLVQAQGKLTMPQAVKALGMKANKSMGGLTGALARKAARYGVDLPFRQSKNQRGDRMWVWRKDS